MQAATGQLSFCREREPECGGRGGGLRLYVLALLFGCDVALAASACLEERSVERRALKES